jgi:hypothetical protein
LDGRKNFEEKLRLLVKRFTTIKLISEELTARAESCGLDTQRIGVPFFTPQTGNCLIGTLTLLNIFQQKLLNNCQLD